MCFHTVKAQVITCLCFSVTGLKIIGNDDGDACVKLVRNETWPVLYSLLMNYIKAVQAII